MLQGQSRKGSISWLAGGGNKERGWRNKKKKRNGLSERIGNSTHATQNPTPIYLTSHFFVLKANSQLYLEVLYSSNPPSFHSLSLFLQQFPGALLSSTADTIQSGQLHGSKSEWVVYAELCHSTPGVTTNRSREYNIDVKCCCSPIQITKFHVPFPHSLIPQLDSEVSRQQRCWFPIQFREQHANKHYQNVAIVDCQGNHSFCCVFYDLLLFVQLQERTVKRNGPRTLDCVISGFLREVQENCVLLGCYAASSGNFLPTFRTNYRSLLQLVKNSKRKPAVPIWGLYRKECGR